MNNINIEKKSKLILFTVIELIYSIFVIAWFFIPQFLADNRLIMPFFLPFINYAKFTINYFYLLFLIPLISIFKIFSILLKKKAAFLCSPDRFMAILLNILSTFIIISIYVYYLLKNTSSIQFFYTQDFKLYFSCSIIIIFNLIFTYWLLIFLINMDASYKTFISFMKLDKLEKKQIKFFLSIQKKLIISILFTIVLVITILSYLVLNDYKNTIVKSVEQIGLTIAEQSAGNFKENFNDNININSYLANENEKNKKYALEFESLTFYKKQGKNIVFKAANSTDPKIIDDILNNNELDLYNTINFSGQIIDKISKTFKFIAPVKLKDTVLGYSILLYKEDAIYESYFKAQIRVILFILLSIYILFMTPLHKGIINKIFNK